MKNGALKRRLAKAKQKPSVSVSIRYPRSDVEALAEIEDVTDLRYDWVIRMLLRRFLRLWKREKKIKLPLAIIVMNYDEALEKGLIEPDVLREQLKKGKGKGSLKQME